MLEYSIGDVFRTEVPFSENGMNAKPRWFIYLGKSPVSIMPVLLYVATTTTRANGYRKNNILYKFHQGEYGFTRDCILVDRDIKDYITTSAFEAYHPIKIGTLPKDVLVQIWRKLQLSKIIRKPTKDDIRDSFRLAGIPT